LIVSEIVYLFNQRVANISKENYRTNFNNTIVTP
jgi:hypothetical protein